MIRCKLDAGAYLPVKEHKEDAGFDLRTPRRVSIRGIDGTAVIDTGVHVEIPVGYVGFIKSKSGLNIKRGITSDAGVIDAGYTGSIVCKLYNHSYEGHTFERGDKIAQLIISPIHECNEMEAVEEIEGGDRGNNGFGSTGR